MRDKIKIIIASIMIFYMSYISIVAILNYKTNRHLLVFSEIDEKYIEEISKYKQEISILPENDCKNYMNKMLQFIEKISNLEEEYQNLRKDGKGFLSYFAESTERCPAFTLEDRDKYLMQLSANLLAGEIIQENVVYPYEITLNNHFISAFYEDDVSGYLSYAKYTLLKAQLEFFDGVLNKVKEVSYEE